MELSHSTYDLMFEDALNDLQEPLRAFYAVSMAKRRAVGNVLWHIESGKPPRQTTADIQAADGDTQESMNVFECPLDRLPRHPLRQSVTIEGPMQCEILGNKRPYLLRVGMREDEHAAGIIFALTLMREHVDEWLSLMQGPQSIGISPRLTRRERTHRLYMGQSRETYHKR